MSIVEVLMRRDGMSRKEAEELVEEARKDLNQRLSEGELPFDICEEWFGLEPDYMIDLGLPC